MRPRDGDLLERQEAMFEVVAGRILSVVAVGAAVIGMQPQREHEHAQPVEQHVNQWEGVTSAIAVIQPTQGNRVRGVVRFQEAEGGVRVTAEIEGLEPNSRHGFHVHQYGDGSAPDATSAGDHYDPKHTGHHDKPNAQEQQHAGDMGNLEADGSGRATYDKVIENVSVAGLVNPIIGRGVVVHAQPDDFGQPTGNAGARIGFGVIGVANPEHGSRRPGGQP